MQIPLLSTLSGAAGPQVLPQPGAEPGAEAFAQLLAGGITPALPVLPEGQAAQLVLPAAAIPTAPSPLSPAPLAPASLATPSLDPAMWAALTAEHGMVFMPTPARPQRPTGKSQPEDGKPLADSGKTLPPASAAPEIALAELLGAGADTTGGIAADPAPAEAPSAPLAFSDLALLQSPPAAPVAQLVPAEPKAVPISSAAAPTHDRQLAASAALALPLAPIAVRENKPRETQAAPPPSPDSAPATAAAPLAAATVNIPLVRTPTTRQPAVQRAPEPGALLQTAPQPAEPQAPTPEAGSAALPAEPPAAPELGAIIDRLVETRIQSREGRSEIAVPHPDFGRVTLALSLAGPDQLSVAMPDAPAELRAAVGQAFAPPPTRSDAAPAATVSENALSSSASGSDPRRDQQGRGEQPRANTYGQQTREFTTNRDNRRQASGRGVLA